MTKKNISRIILAVMIITNIYLIWRVNSNTMTIASYDAGISQRTGVGKLESYWTKYIGGSKGSLSQEDRERAESDSNTSTMLLFILDIAFIGGLYWINKKPAPATVKEDNDELKISRRSNSSNKTRPRHR